MDMIETRMKNFNGSLPVYYKRYVDDIFCIFDKNSDASAFHDFLNTLHPDIKFTMEREVNESLVFLDTKVTKSENAFDIAWHLKETNTGIYIPNSAYAPKRYRLAAMNSLFYRALKLNSNPNNYQNSVSAIQALFQKNGFSERTILRMREKVEARHKANVARPNAHDDFKFITWSFPYISESEQNLLSRVKDINKFLPPDMKVRPVFKTLKTSNFFSNKDKVVPELKSNVVYKYTCDHCEKCYVGSSIRHFATRINEHLKAYPTPTEISMHVHPPKKENFDIIACTEYPRFLESIIIKKSDFSTLMNERASSINTLLDL